MKNIYCIVGPSGCGKTTLVEALEKRYGYKSVQSYTTRLPRYEGETGHIFVTPEEFKQLGKMCAYTRFDGHEYGVTADLIEQNDLYVIDPAGVEFLRDKYNGSKGVKVIGIKADVDVLVERMQGRGDSDEKIVSRLANDAEMFKSFTNITDIELRSDFFGVDELCDAVKWHIENYEYWAKHEFSLLNEHGEVVAEGKRFYDYEDAFASLKKSYPEGVPQGWTLRDDTEVAREKYLKAIKKLKPSFKSSLIHINMDDAGTSSDGYTVVSFNYKGKNSYYFRSYNGDEWITEKGKRVEEQSASVRLSEEIERLYKRIDKIDKELAGEYQDGETVNASQLEIKKERFEKTICFLESALSLVNKEVVKSTPGLDVVIRSANKQKNTLNQCFDKQKRDFSR